MYRMWNESAGKCTWCVFLRFVDQPSDGEGEEGSTQGAAEGSSENENGGGRQVRVCQGDRHHIRARDVAYSSLMGWGNEREALDALVSSGFDVEAAVGAMESSYDRTGFWRDKFSAWEVGETETLCEAASRHHDDLAHLVTVLDTKTPVQVIEFYNHLLRNGHDYSTVGRLVATAEQCRESGGSRDPDLPPYSKGDDGYKVT